MFDETHAMQISEYLCFTYQIVAFFSGSKKSHEFGTIEIPKSACFAQLKATRNRTGDTRIFSPLLYHLSYGTSVFACAKVMDWFEFTKYSVAFSI